MSHLRYLFLARSLSSKNIPKILVESGILAVGSSVTIGLAIVMLHHTAIYRPIPLIVPSAFIMLAVGAHCGFTCNFPSLRAAIVSAGAAWFFQGSFEIFRLYIFLYEVSLSGVCVMLFGFWTIVRFYSEGPR